VWRCFVRDQARVPSVAGGKNLTPVTKYARRVRVFHSISSIPVSEVLWRSIPVFQTRKASIFIAILHATCTRPLAKYPNIPQAKAKYRWRKYLSTARVILQYWAWGMQILCY